MKNKALIPILISLLFAMHLVAQTSFIDDLKSKLPTASDSLKSTIYHDLCLAYIRVDIDSSEFYANLDYKLNRANNNLLGMALSFESFGTIKSIIGDLDSSDYYFDTAYQIYLVNGEINGQTTCMGWLSNNQSIRGNYEQSIALLKRSVELKIANNDTINIQKFYQNLGVDNHMMGNFDEAEIYYNKAIEISVRGKDSISLGYLYGNLGQINISKSEYEIALDYLMTSQIFNKANGNIFGMATNFDRMGSIFLLQKKYELALEYYRKANRGFEKVNNKEGLAAGFLNIGNVFADAKIMDSAIFFSNKAYIVIEDYDNLALRAAIEVQLANFYLLTDELVNAEKFSFKALNSSLSLNDNRQVIAAYIIRGKVLFEQKKYRDALEVLHKAEKLNSTLDNLLDEVHIYTSLYRIYEQLDDTRSALKYHKLFANAQDSLTTKLNSEKVLDFQTKYQSAEKQRENQRLLFENKIQKQENDRSKLRNLYMLTIFGFVLLLLVIAFFVSRTIQKNMYNKLMLSEIDEQNDIIAKNLHDGMSGYLHAIKNSLVFRNEKTNDLKTEIKIIDRSQKELRFLMRQLSSPYYKNKNFYLSQELDELKSFYENTSDFKIESYFDQSIVWENISYDDKLQIYKLVQELLANVKKHSGASTLSLQMVKDKNNLIISFEDDGKGFDTDVSSHGHGLKNINKRIHELRGEINIESNIGQGTFTTFTLPVLA